MAGQQAPHVLDAEISLERRLTHVADRRHQRTDEGESDRGLGIDADRVPFAQPEHQERQHHRDRNTAEQPLLGLVRARRRQRRAAEGLADEVRADVVAHRHHHRSDDHADALIGGLVGLDQPGLTQQQRRETAQTADVGDAQQGRAEVTHHVLSRLRERVPREADDDGQGRDDRIRIRALPQRGKGQPSNGDHPHDPRGPNPRLVHRLEKLLRTQGEHHGDENRGRQSTGAETEHADDDQCHTDADSQRQVSLTITGIGPPCDPTLRPLTRPGRSLLTLTLGRRVGL